MHILIADDDPVSRQILSHILGSAGHTVLSVTDASAACAAIGGGAYQAALLDLGVPGGGGATVAQALATAPRRPRLIACTAAAVAEAELRRAGFDAWVGKPVRPAELFSALGLPAPRARCPGAAGAAGLACALAQALDGGDLGQALAAAEAVRAYALDYDQPLLVGLAARLARALRTADAAAARELVAAIRLQIAD